MKKNERSSKLPVVNLVLILVLFGIGLPGVYLLSRSEVSREVASRLDNLRSTDTLGAGAVQVQYKDKNNLESLQDSYRAIAKEVLPEVVQVNVTEVVTQQAPSSPFDFMFGNGGAPQRYTQKGLGSGVIVRKNGKTVYVLTNNHVAGNAQEIAVKLYDGREYTAKLVGADEYRDLALISFTSDDNIPVATLGDSSTLQPGDIVLAVGNPLGFASTITAGIVSAVGRNAETGTDVASFTDYIQTDAAINQGNSGGALVNLDGEVIGINSWIASTSGGSIGLGFAIPINNAKQAIGDFITKGKVEYGWLGINSSDPPADVVKAMDLGKAKGTFVIDVYRDSPADKAGILPGDFVTTLAGKTVEDSNEIIRIISGLRPGQTVPVSLFRQGKTVNASVKIGTRAGSSELSGEANKLWPGFLVIPVTQDLQGQLGLSGSEGLLVVNVEDGTPAAQAGLQPGDVVTAMNGTRLRDMSEFYRLLNRNAGKTIQLTVERKGAQGTLELR